MQIYLFICVFVYVKLCSLLSRLSRLLFLRYPHRKMFYFTQSRLSAVNYGKKTATTRQREPTLNRSCTVFYVLFRNTKSRKNYAILLAEMLPSGVWRMI